MIKWKRLQRICNEIVPGDGVSIHLTTDMDPSIRGAVVNRDILLNAQHCKSEDDVIEAIAHEVAHILTGDKESNEFMKKLIQLRKYIRKKYYGKKR